MTDETMSSEAGSAAADGAHGEAVVEEGADTEILAKVYRLEQDVAARDSELSALKNTLAGVVAKYRAAVAATASGVPEELIRGETVEEIDASLEQARSIVSRVRAQLESDAAAQSVPAGAPPRTLPDMSALSPAEKIVHALTAERR